MTENTEFTQRAPVNELNEALEEIRREISKVIVGQNQMVELLLVSLLADGHILIEGVPGVAKTLVAKLMAKLVHAKFSRIQFTPDLLPADLVGTMIYSQKKEEFIVKKDNNDFLEWAEVHGNFYGTSKTFVEECLRTGKHVLFDLDVQGTDSMKAYFGSVANVIFISPPSVEELEKRLRHRGTESTQVINLRIMNARKELLRKNDFDFLILNDDIENAYSRLKEITQKILLG